MIKWIGFGLLICVLGIVEWIREIHSFKMTHYHISSKKLNGLNKERKVVLLSDLHNYCYGNNNDKLLDAIEKEQPDYILVAGDMIVSRIDESTKVAEDFMIQLPKICDTYYANGNHEQRMKEQEDRYGDSFKHYQSILEKAGVHWLSNEKVSVKWDECMVNILGLELPQQKYKKFQKQSLEVGEVRQFLGDTDPTGYNLMIAHNPTFMDTYLKWGADLVVSGHLHGGVVRLPFVGGVISPQFDLFPKYSGEMKKVGEAVAVVSKGIGIHTIKVRLFNPAEVVVMHINGAEE